MNDLQKRLENLSPEKYELLLQKLKRDKSILPGKEASQTSTIKPVFRDSEIPLSFAQRRLWFLDQLEGASTVYNLPFALRLTGPLHIEALKKSLNQIVQRHEVLRTNFADKKGHPVQIITPEIIIPLPVMDLRHLPGVERDAEVQRQSMQEAQRPFNLAKDTLIRAILLWLRGAELQNGDQEYVMLLSIHHIVSDGWSLDILVHELSVLYESCITGRPSPLQPLPIQYADFAFWQRQWLEGERLNTELDYWKKQLADAPMLLELPTDRPRPAVQTFKGRADNFLLNAELTRRLNLLSQRSGATPFMTLLVAFAVLLSRYSGQEEIVIGSPIANRNRKEIEPLIGFFVNTLVLRIDMSGNPSFNTLLERVKQMALDAYAHQDFPFERLVDELRPERNLSHAPLFQVMFILQNAPTTGSLKLSGLEIDSLSIATGRTHFDLVMCLTEADSKLSGILEYSTDLFDRGTIARMIQHFQTLLEGITADPDQSIWSFPMLNAADRRRILVEWNDTRRDYPYHECIHHLFESQAKRTPEATSVFSDGHRWSYGDLNARANQLAHLLREKGVGPDRVVGLMMDRSLDMVMGILAILKAGGACLPIDPEYPEERILTMLNGSGALLLLTKERLIRHLSFTSLQNLYGTHVSPILTRPRSPVDDFDRIIRANAPKKEKAEDALRVLMLDLSLLLSSECGDMLYDMVEAPLGLMSLMTYIDKRFGSHVSGKIAKSRIDFDSFEDLKGLIEDFHPQVVGIRTLSSYKNFFHKIVSLIRQEYPDVPIITGGSYAASEFNTLLADRNVDVVVLGEGELTFADLIESFMENGGRLPSSEVLEKIPGLAFLPRRLPGAAREVLMLDRMEDLLARQEVINPEGANRGADLAYVLYTSGSTGKPKGVAMVHQALSNLILWHLDDKRLSKKAKTVQFAPFTFDVSFQEIFSTWCSGGTLFLISEDTRRDAGALWRLLKEKDIERLFLPFVALRQLAEIAEGSENMPSSLRDVITAGEQLQITPAIAGLFERLRDCSLHNHYGPAETHVVTAFTLDRLPVDWPKLPPIGRPIANTQIYILDRLGGLVPPGVPGELFIGGVALARGYLGRPALTYKKFIPDPFSNDSASRLYRTGDLARWLPGGNIEYLGRIDNQVKIRGFRIEPGEIEAVLAGYPGVRETAVVAKEYAPGDRRLVAYVVTDSGMQIAISDLRDFLKKKLPEYMVPSRFVMLAKLPLTSSGKVNRLALPEPDASPGGPEGDYVFPRTPVEEILTALWAEVLKVERIGIHDNFFDLGGHSLLATQLISRIRDAFSLELPIRRLFESPTIAELGEHIEAGGHKDMTPPIRPVERDRDLPLSFDQERLWFLTQFEGESATYNMPAALKLTGHLNISALKQSFHEIIDRHESLRTVFAMKNGYPVQVILPAMTLPFVIKDLRELTDEKRFIEFQRLASEEAQCPFDISSGPLVRIILFQLANKEYVLLVNLHHIVFDGWSIGLFINELSISYNAFSTNTPALLPELTVQYADYACWQRERQTDEVKESHLTYWMDKLEKAPVEVLPIDLSPPEVRSYRGGIVNFEINAVISRKLYDIGLKAGTSFFMTLLSAFNALLFRLSGQEDIVVGVPIANRNRKEIEPLIGFFVNILPFRTDLSGKPTFQELLKRVRKVTLDAYAHHDVPFVKLIQALRPDRKFVRQPLYQVSFGLMNSTMGGPKFSGLDLKPLKLFSGMAPCDLFLSVTETDSGLMSFFSYDTDIFKSTTIAMLAEHFKMFLKGVVQDPECCILDVPLLRSNEVILGNRGTEPTLIDETDQFQF